MSRGIESGSSMSCSASYNGRRYASIFSYRVPGRNPSRSPASTAGRVRMIRLTCLACKACTALAIARYVLPVPAGPMPNTIVFESIASTYRFWFSVLGRMVRPRRDTMSRLRTSAGDSAAPADSIATVRRTASGPMCWPRSARMTSSENTRSANATSAGGPDSVTSLPRTWTSAASSSSATLRFSSLEPSNARTAWSGTVNREDTTPATPWADAPFPARPPDGESLASWLVGTGVVVSDRDGTDRAAPPCVLPATGARAYFLRVSAVGTGRFDASRPHRHRAPDNLDTRATRQRDSARTAPVAPRREHAGEHGTPSAQHLRQC